MNSFYQDEDKKLRTRPSSETSSPFPGAAIGSVTNTAKIFIHDGIGALSMLLLTVADRIRFDGYPKIDTIRTNSLRQAEWVRLLTQIDKGASLVDFEVLGMDSPPTESTLPSIRRYLLGCMRQLPPVLRHVFKVRKVSQMTCEACAQQYPQHDNARADIMIQRGATIPPFSSESKDGPSSPLESILREEFRPKTTRVSRKCEKCGKTEIHSRTERFIEFPRLLVVGIDGGISGGGGSGKGIPGPVPRRLQLGRMTDGTNIRYVFKACLCVKDMTDGASETVIVISQGPIVSPMDQSGGEGGYFMISGPGVETISADFDPSSAPLKSHALKSGAITAFHRTTMGTPGTGRGTSIFQQTGVPFILVYEALDKRGYKENDDESSEEEGSRGDEIPRKSVGFSSQLVPPLMGADRRSGSAIPSSMPPTSNAWDSQRRSPSINPTPHPDRSGYNSSTPGVDRSRFVTIGGGPSITGMTTSIPRQVAQNSPTPPPVSGTKFGATYLMQSGAETGINGTLPPLAQPSVAHALSPLGYRPPRWFIIGLAILCVFVLFVTISCIVYFATAGKKTADMSFGDIVIKNPAGLQFRTASATAASVAAVANVPSHSLFTVYGPAVITGGVQVQGDVTLHGDPAVVQGKLQAWELNIQNGYISIVGGDGTSSMDLNGLTVTESLNVTTRMSTDSLTATSIKTQFASVQHSSASSTFSGGDMIVYGAANIAGSLSTPILEANTLTVRNGNGATTTLSVGSIEVTGPSTTAQSSLSVGGKTTVGRSLIVRDGLYVPNGWRYDGTHLNTLRIQTSAVNTGIDFSVPVSFEKSVTINPGSYASDPLVTFTGNEESHFTSLSASELAVRGGNLQVKTSFTTGSSCLTELSKLTIQGTTDSTAPLFSVGSVFSITENAVTIRVPRPTGSTVANLLDPQNPFFIKYLSVTGDLTIGDTLIFGKSSSSSSSTTSNLYQLTTNVLTAATGSINQTHSISTPPKLIVSRLTLKNTLTLRAGGTWDSSNAKFPDSQVQMHLGDVDVLGVGSLTVEGTLDGTTLTNGTIRCPQGESCSAVLTGQITCEDLTANSITGTSTGTVLFNKATVASLQPFDGSKTKIQNIRTLKANCPIQVTEDVSVSTLDVTDSMTVTIPGTTVNKLDVAGSATIAQVSADTLQMPSGASSALEMVLEGDLTVGGTVTAKTLVATDLADVTFGAQSTVTFGSDSNGVSAVFNNKVEFPKSATESATPTIDLPSQTSTLMINTDLTIDGDVSAGALCVSKITCTPSLTSGNAKFDKLKADTGQQIPN